MISYQYCQILATNDYLYNSCDWILRTNIFLLCDYKIKIST